MSQILFMFVTANAPLLAYAQNGSLAYIVSLVFDRTHNYKGGSGVLISSDWVLTAAHCIDERFITHIQYGKVSHPQVLSSSTSEILKKIQHPGYRKGKRFSNDIGLLRVVTVYLETYGKLSNIDYKSLLGLPILYAGYGGVHRKNTAGGEIDRSLYCGKGIVTTCEEKSSAGPYICVAPKCSDKRKTFNWTENNGGPLLYDTKIAGILSWSKESSMNGRFTALSPFLSWIEKQVNDGYKYSNL